MEKCLNCDRRIRSCALDFAMSGPRSRNYGGSMVYWPTRQLNCSLYWASLGNPWRVVAGRERKREKERTERRERGNRANATNDPSFAIKSNQITRRKMNNYWRYKRHELARSQCTSSQSLQRLAANRTIKLKGYKWMHFLKIY